LQSANKGKGENFNGLLGERGFDGVGFADFRGRGPTSGKKEKGGAMGELVSHIQAAHEKKGGGKVFHPFERNVGKPRRRGGVKIRRGGKKKEEEVMRLNDF